ncbi:MAG: branched-chain amino acid ABC transporter permease [Desulfovibrio sp.]|jgi:branched-chain amino acid transport system permease protein|nr:branched-chain amino acid ABC transporter permease [Desulfovibrio sp.]
MNKILKDPLLWIFLIFSAYPFMPYIGSFISLGSELLLWFVFALGFNLCLGQTGLPSFGHGAFFGMGSYAAAISFLRLFNHDAFVMPILAGIVLGAAAAALLGWLIREKKGVYFAMLTVAFTQVCFGIAFRWDEVTGGEAGLSGVLRGAFFGLPMNNPIVFYYFCFLVFIVCAVIIRKISRSCFGLSLQSVRQNPLRSQYLGYNIGLYKFSVYTISGGFAGLAGALYCLLTQSAYADVLDWSKSGDVVMATLLGGGTVSFYGPILGSLIFVICKNLISSMWVHWALLYGLSFVIILSFFPTGLMGIVKKKRNLEPRLRGNAPAQEQTRREEP